ncbi:MAG: aminodeoxychorismate/anthranilate synthase component II [Rikenellaceae bacterium]
MQKILILDNYDSFTHNIAHMVESLGFECDIFRNDKIELDDIEKYDKIILSPGPGIPSEAGILCSLIERYGATKSIFGVCLGEQAIGEVYGAKLINLSTVFHGIESDIEITEPSEAIFDSLEGEFKAGRYHSWVVSGDELPSDIEVTAIEKTTGQIMAIRHKKYDVRGVQFHPESVLTPQGATILSNWLTSTK